LRGRHFLPETGRKLEVWPGKMHDRSHSARRRPETRRRAMTEATGQGDRNQRDGGEGSGTMTVDVAN
jgi:hypothetical protein